MFFLFFFKINLFTFKLLVFVESASSGIKDKLSLSDTSIANVFNPLKKSFHRIEESC